jgi:hypothetical protein
MRRIWASGLLIVMCGLSPSVVRAETPLEFDLHLGPSITLGDFSDAVGTGVFVSGTILAKVAPAVGLGIEFGGSLGHENGPNQATILQVTPVVRAQGALGSHGVGFVQIGAGYYHTAYSGFIGGGGSNFGVNFGAGLLFAIAPQFSLGFDVRYHHIFESGSDPEFLVPAAVLTFTPGGS